MSETCGPVAFVAPTRDRTALLDNVGRPAPGIEIRICDEQGRPVGAGETGEIRIAGDCVMAGYFNRPEETRAAIDGDGWLRTGDLARLRPDGTLALVGRLTELYKSGGYNIHPREIERVLEAHPAVALVAVVRTPDPQWQEVGHAFLVPRAGSAADAAALEGWCRGRLANYKVPKRFTIRAELPTLGSGKIDRKALEREAAAIAADEREGRRA
jgi:fatty-acyl-CoA synthase